MDRKESEEPDRGQDHAHDRKTHQNVRELVTHRSISLFATLRELDIARVSPQDPLKLLGRHRPARPREPFRLGSPGSTRRAGAR